MAVIDKKQIKTKQCIMLRDLILCVLYQGRFVEKVRKMEEKAVMTMTMSMMTMN